MMHFDELANKVKLLSAAIPEGQTANGLSCPKCRGGIHNDRAFSVTRTAGELKFICYRASCGFSGVIDSQGCRGTPRKNKPPQIKILETKALSKMAEKYLRKKFDGLSDTFFSQCRSLVTDDGIAMPVRTPRGERYGYMARKYTALGWSGYGQKNIIYSEAPEYVRGDFTHCRRNSKTVFIVEDQVSADCVHNVVGLDTYALLGTHIAENIILALLSLGYKQLVIAFDEDAWGKANKFKQRFGLFGIDVMTWKSGLDPKDMNREELNEVFKDYAG